MSLSTRWAYWCALLLLLVPICLGAVSWLAPAEAEYDQAGAGGSLGAENAAGGVSVDSFMGSARGAAPFRPDGRPSGVAYDPTRSEMRVQEYAPAKPLLTLNGILDGPVPLALIEGIPGREGPAVLGVGDTLAGLRLRKIKDGAVTVTGMDTTWVLRIREQ